MDPGWSKAGDSLEKTIKGTPSAKYKVPNQEKLLSLINLRDFISLLLTYPVKLEEEGILKAWINAFFEWKAQLLSIDDDGDAIDNPWCVMTEKALKCVEGLIPYEIISQIKNCEAWPEMSIFDNDVPEAILPLTVDLAVEQLIQTLFSGDYYACNMHHLRLSTRNLVEKRSMVKKIAAALEDRNHMFGMDKDFLRSIWIDSSKYESDVAEVRVQEEINEVMAEYTDQEEMANNRYLVILVGGDNDKKSLDPRKLGFPPGVVVLIIAEQSAYAKEEEEFAITCTMDLDIRTQDHVLPWKVFCSYVGISMEHSSMVIQRIAVQIVEACRGHLLAIVLVAKFLKNVEDVQLWELALYKLSNMSPSFNYQEIDRVGISRVMVNAFLNIIWEGINKTQRHCLEANLFVPKIKNGVPREILTSNWVSTLLIPTQECNIKELLDRSVLLQHERNDVYLPVETYDLIKSLHTLNPSIIKHGALGLTEPPDIGQWHGLIRIELMDNKICELPESPNCPKLKVLLLQGNVDLIDIPDSFFDHMPLLEYLDLSYTSIRELPHSFSRLKELKKFYLRGCDLFMELPQNIGQLKNLEELDLDRTLITHLPEEIRELTNLQSMTLCFDRYHPELGHSKMGKQNSNSTIIPPGVISNLTLLKYLSINVDPEDERWNKNVDKILLEIFALKRLKTVSIYVPEAELLELISTYTQPNFRLVVGHHKRRFISRVTPEVEEKFKLCDSSIKFINGKHLPNGVKVNLERLRALYLDRHMTIKSLSEFEVMKLSMLKECILAECIEMETVIDGSYSHDRYALPRLELLSVFYMKNLRSICERPCHMNTSFLCSLKSMALHTCPMLTTIFSLSFLGNLSLLEELIVEDCPKVTTLVSRDTPKHERNIFLPRLRKITLLYLPELINIFNGLHVGQSLQKMGFYYCPKLQSLSKTELSSGLRVIKGESGWWETLKWNEAEWGNAGRPNFLNLIFSPINVEADILVQLTAHHDVDKDQVSFSKDNSTQTKNADNIVKLASPSNEETGIMAQLFVADQDVDEDQMGSPSHSQPLQYKSPGAPYRCSGCHELGFGASYHCEKCSYTLHDECTNPVSFATHPFFPNSYFEFCETAHGHSTRYCDACGKDVLGFVYHCSKTGFDLHPCCLKLRGSISDEKGLVKLELSKKVPSKCAKCKHRNVVDGVKGWSYVSSDVNKFCYHVSCVKELVLENWKRGYFSQENTNSIGMSSGTEREYSQLALRSTEMVQSGRRTRRSGTIGKYAKIAVVVFRLIFSAIFGNPVSAIAALVEALVTD